MDGYSLPFNPGDIKEAGHSFTPVKIGGTRTISEDCEIHFHSAGHIPGSIMYEINGEKKILFTGDFNVPFLDKIDEVVSRGGVVVILSFAVARTQEIAMVLRKAGYDVWFDGMGKKVAKLFLKYPEELRSVENLKKAVNKLNFVHSDHGRKLALKSEVILTSSGMMDGGFADNCFLRAVMWYYVILTFCHTVVFSRDCLNSKKNKTNNCGMHCHTWIGS